VTKVKAYAAPSESAPLIATMIDRREVGPDDVQFDVLFCGICHSDIHTVRGEWGKQTYPLAPGHELAGKVTAVGKNITKFKIGDHVGVGCLVNSCLNCEPCKTGHEQFCQNGAIFTYGSSDRDGTVTQGGYTQSAVVNHNFVVHIPMNLPLEAAAPLLCAGSTLWAPLKRWNAGPGKKVAIIGFGGLGHVGLKLAKAMGAEVTVLSHSDKKKEDALKMGAFAFHKMDASAFESLKERYDIILNTVSATIDTAAYYQLLKFDGIFVVIGADPSPSVSVSTSVAVSKQRVFTLSLISGIQETQDMLNFCGEHNVLPELELIPASYINEAFDRVVASDVRYRFVIDNSTM
jgi:uncharacterized zinc-type alcohol dehydrogenase-like protein